MTTRRARNVAGGRRLSRHGSTSRSLDDRRAMSQPLSWRHGSTSRSLDDRRAMRRRLRSAAR